MIGNWEYHESYEEMYEESLEEDGPSCSNYSPEESEKIPDNIVDKFFCSYCDIILDNSELKSHIYDEIHVRNMEEVALNTRRRNLEAMMKTITSTSESKSSCELPKTGVRGKKELVIKKKLISSKKRRNYYNESDDEIADDEDTSEGIYKAYEMIKNLNCW